LTTRQALRATLLVALAVWPIACDPPDDPFHPGGGGDGGGGAGGGGAGGGGGSSNARFFLPTGEPDNTSAPTVEIDGRGNLHMVYPAYAGGDAYYAFFPARGGGAARRVASAPPSSLRPAILGRTMLG
jgi:hypothetical protein